MNARELQPPEGFRRLALEDRVHSFVVRFVFRIEPECSMAVHRSGSGGAVERLRAGGRIVSFAVYSPVSSDLWTVHFEKTRYEYKGASQYITHKTAAALQGRACLLNREQDLGIPGLRQAKKSYDPLFLLQNYKLIRRL